MKRHLEFSCAAWPWGPRTCSRRFRRNVALITGIYDDLLQSISAVSLGLVDTWKNEGFKGSCGH